MFSPLSRTETNILRSLSHGTSYAQTAENIGLTLECMHTMAYRIRQKTGIVDTKNPADCKAWFTQVKDYDRSTTTQPTRAQLNVMTLLAEGKDYDTIACELEMSRSTAQVHAYEGCKRAGIVGKRHYRTCAIKEYLEGLKILPYYRAAAPVPDPLDEF